jgi:periplasmic protein TonB
MSVHPVPEVSSQEASFLRGCLVEGDSAQESRVRRNKRRAILISIGVQILVVAAVIFFPLFSKGENIAARAVFTPTVPYNPGRAPVQEHTTSRPPSGHPNSCRFCPPLSIPNHIVYHDPAPVGDPTGQATDSIPGAPNGEFVPGLLTSNDGPRKPDAEVTPRKSERVRISAPVQQAMLIRRIEPIYPPLAIQIRHEGRVELHAIISKDGSIQSLEVISGDPLFIQSSLDAVRQWRYRATILDGDPVEVDTHITVIYTLNH